KDQYSVLEFFVTESLSTLIKKRAAFLVTHQQHRDPSKWYNGLFSEWDMKANVLRGPDDKDGLADYILASDDPGLCKAPYIAAKNAIYPDAKEIEAVEYYLKNFVWGKLQMTTEEKYPYAVYGIDNWITGRSIATASPLIVTAGPSIYGAPMTIHTSCSFTGACIRSRATTRSLSTTWTKTDFSSERMAQPARSTHIRGNLLVGPLMILATTTS